MNQEQLTPLIDKYHRVLQQNPRSLVFAPLAECYRKLGMIKEASTLLRDGIKNHPQYVLGHLGMAELAKDQGNYQLVYTLLKSFKDTHRDNFKLMKLYARSCFQLQHFEEALQAYKYILFLNPKDKDAAMMIDQLEDQPILRGDIDKNSSSKEYFKVNDIDTNMLEENDWVEKNFNSNSNTNDSDDWKMQAIQDLPVVESVETHKDNYFDSNIEVEREFNIAPQMSVESDGSVEDQPFITHTLVDLYVGQGYLEKASELLEKILELNPSDEKSAAKLNNIRSSMVEAGIVTMLEKPRIQLAKEEDQTEDEGRSKLMRILDATLMESKINSHLTQNASAVKEQLEKKLWFFHERLREKALRNQE